MVVTEDHTRATDDKIKPLGKLYGKRTGTATRTINQDFLPRLHLSLIANPLQGDHSCLRDGRCLLEGKTRWFQRHGRSTGADILCKTTAIAWDLPKHLVSWFEFRVVFAD